MRLLRDSFAILLGLVFSVAGSRATTTVVFPSFELNRFGSEELVKLDDFTGSIVILDDRIVRKRYGTYLRESLPATPFVKGPWSDVSPRLKEFYTGS